MTNSPGRSGLLIPQDSLGADGSHHDAVSAIIRILMDAQGNADVSLYAKGATASVSTGEGDDTIIIDSTSGTTASIFMVEGDGHDTIETDTALSIQRYSADGTTIDTASADIAENGDGSMTISFAGGADSVTVRFSGALNGADIAVAQAAGGSLLIDPASPAT